MKNIYIVEDDRDILELCEHLLSTENFKVSGYTTAEEFHTNIGKALPDLVILDIMLPDANGLEMCMELCANELTTSIPIVLMSAHESPDILKKEVCAQDFIAKPFDIDDFVFRISRQLA